MGATARRRPPVGKGGFAGLKRRILEVAEGHLLIKGNVREAIVMLRMECPKCHRRAFDLSDLPREKIIWRGKCPQCHQFVTIPCTKDFEMIDASFILGKSDLRASKPR
jgi:hypothetical protein